MIRDYIPRFYRDKMFWHWIILSLLAGTFFGFLSCSWEVFALIFTAVTLIWYSVETRGLRLEARESNRLSVLPALVLIQEEVNGTNKFFIKNLGKGLAINPRVIVISNSKEEVFALDYINVIAPGDRFIIPDIQRTIEGHHGKQNLGTKITFSSSLDPFGDFFTEQDIKDKLKIIKTNWY